MAKSGDAYNAAVLLQQVLDKFENKKRSDTSVGRSAGAGIGAVVGSFIFPGIGTVIGGALGGLLGSSIGEAEIESESSLKAETHYRLGVIYEMLHNPALLHHYMQAKALNPDHAQAEEALRRVQPQIPASPQLNALDDDL